MRPMLERTVKRRAVNQPVICDWDTLKSVDRLTDKYQLTIDDFANSVLSAIY
ncbi:Uncharacterised protein [Salmonella enterica subsp. arizonae]|uniref:Uncharacterized protein n=1 Tax=Salmonella enterica subsp. arizonae TaxID=59203 RepID=A0A3S5DGK1_SALER|nr:Uncharacterised protein [Salmonella enterica subsp. arizonae]